MLVWNNPISWISDIHLGSFLIIMSLQIMFNVIDIARWKLYYVIVDKYYEYVYVIYMGFVKF